MFTLSPPPRPDRPRPVREALLIGGSLIAVAVTLLAANRLTDSAGLDCQDYDNPGWQGQPFQTRVERDFSTPLFVTRPARVRQVFSTDCHGTLLIERSDTFTFAAASRNPVELALDDQSVLQMHGPPLQHRSSIVTLQGGPHRLRFRFAFAGGADEPELFMARAGDPLRPLDPDAVSRQPQTATAYALRAPARAARVVLPIIWVAFVAYRLRWTLGRASRSMGTWLAPAHHWVLGGTVRAPAIIVGVAVAARLALTFGTYPILWPDSVQYYDTALAFLRGDFKSHNLISTPLFPAFMAAFLSWNITPVAGAAMIGVQRILAIGATVLVYRLARAAFDQTTAFYATLLWTVSTVQLYYETTVSTEALFVVVLICTVVVASRLLRNPSVVTSAVVGLMCAVATLTRPVAKSLVIIVLAVVWWRSAQPRRRLILPSVVLVATFCVGIVPWMYVNQQTYGYWGVSRGEGLWLFLRAIDIDELDPPAETRFPEVRQVFDALRPTYPYLHYPVRDELNYGRGYSASGADEAMLGFAIETVMAHPVSFAVGTVKQWALLMVNPYRSVHICGSHDGPHLCSERGQDLDFRAFPNKPPAGRKALKTAIAAYFDATYWLLPLMGPLAIIGMTRSRVRRDQHGNLQVLLAVIVLYLTGVTALFNTVQDRYRLPADAFIAMFAIHEVRCLSRRFAAP